MSSNAVLASSSKSTSLFIESKLEYFDIAAAILTTGDALREYLKENRNQDLVFASLEVLKELDPNPALAIAQLRDYYFGSLYILTANSDQDELKALIERGATDVISLQEINQLESILNTFSIYQSVQALDTTLTALVVEDSKTQRELIKQILDELNVQISFVPTVREALMVMKFEPVDMVITDIHLAGDMTGMQLMREICQNSQWRGIPTLAVSGVLQQDSVRDLYRLGVRDFLTKPLDWDIFGIKVRNMVSERLMFKKLERESKRLQVVAYTDSLTSLNNRAYLKQQFEEWTNEREHKYGVVLFDLDNLKEINDEYGHDIGDEAIKTVAQTLMNNVSPDDIAIRLGGDEFVVLLESSDPETIHQFAKSVQDEMRTGFSITSKKLEASVGADLINKEMTLSDVLKRVDALMYLAKGEGKNQIEVSW